MTGTAPAKYLQVADELETRIHNGEWDSAGRMPSLRDIAEHYSVSVVTASRAVQILRDRGLVGRIDRSGCYLAQADGQTDIEKWGLCLRVTPGPWQQHSHRLTMESLEALKRREAVEFVEVIQPDGPFTFPHLRGQLREALAEGIRGVILLPTRNSPETAEEDELFLRACEAEGMEVVLLDRNLRGEFRPLERDLVAVDDVEGERACTEHLLEVGCHRVAIIRGSPCNSHTDRVAGYLLALQAAVASGRYPNLHFQPLVIDRPEGVPDKEADRWVVDWLLDHQVDGVACYQDSLAIGLILEMLARGVRVPHDVKVVGFDDLPIGDLFTLGVTTYSYPGEAIMRQAVRLLRQRVARVEGPALKVLVPGKLIVRESTGGGSAQRRGPPPKDALAEVDGQASQPTTAQR